MAKVDSRVSGSTEPFGVEVTYQGAPMVVTGSVFELRPAGGAVVVTGAGSQPVPGVIVFEPSPLQAAQAAGNYQYRFTCQHAHDAGGRFIHPWVRVEIEQ